MKKKPLLPSYVALTVVGLLSLRANAQVPQPSEDGLSALSHMSFSPPPASQPTPQPTPQTTSQPASLLHPGAPSSFPSGLTPPTPRPAMISSGAVAPAAPVVTPATPATPVAPASKTPAEPEAGLTEAPPPSVASAPVIAQTSNPFATHVSELPPILRIFEENNIRITSLGGEGGLRGYLLEEPGGRMQVVYLTPDGKSLVVGVMQTIGNDGKHLENVTMLQFAEMRQRFEAAQHSIEEQKRAADEARKRAEEANANLAQQQNRLTQASQQFNAPMLGVQPASGGDESAIGHIVSGSNNPKESSVATPTPAQPPVENSAPAPAPMTATPVGPRTTSMLSRPTTTASEDSGGNDGPATKSSSAYVVSLSKERFLSDMEKTAYFPVGANNAPVLYMVADPQCPHCHAAWQYLKPLVASGKLTVKVIMVSALPGSESIALSLLSQAAPGRAWWDGEGSENGHPVSPGAAANTQAMRNGQKYLDINMQFLTSHKIDGTPWLGYVGADGKVYEMEGDQNLPSFLSEIKGL